MPGAKVKLRRVPNSTEGKRLQQERRFKVKMNLGTRTFDYNRLALACIGTSVVETLVPWDVLRCFGLRVVSEILA